jgi:hypothetical protein
MRAPPLLVLFALTVSATALAASAIPPGCQEDYGSCKEDCTIEYGGNGRTISKLTRCFQGCQETMDLCGARHSSLKEMKDLGLPEGTRDSDAALTGRAARKGATVKEKDKAREDDPFGDSEPAPRHAPRQEESFDDPAPSARKGDRQGYRTSPVGEPEAPAEPARPAAPTAPSAASRTTAPAPAPSAPTETSRRGVYRASESEPPPPPSPAVAPKDEPELEPLAESKPAPQAAPPPKPAPAKPSVAETAAPTSTVKDPLIDDEPPPPPPVAKKPAPASTRPVPPPEPKHDISDWDPGD